MPTSPRLSVLDLSPIPSGSTARAALDHTVELARLAERLGYVRFWVAEHHNTAGLASSSPEVLIGHVASATSTIRVGSGGVMLPNHSPLAVAERFRLLEALHPGRIDLGIGRAPGTDGLTALALRRSREALVADDLPEQLAELLGYLTGSFPAGHPFARITAAPVGVDCPEVWILGSSGYGGVLAAHLGLGCGFAHHIHPGPAVEVLRDYRRSFRPSRHRAEPASLLAVSVVCADTDEEARHLAGTLELLWLRISRGDLGDGIPSPEQALAHHWTAADDAVRRASRARAVVGSPETVHRTLTDLAAAAQADEVMVTSMIHDHHARLRSYELLADAFALAPTAG